MRWWMREYRVCRIELDEEKYRAMTTVGELCAYLESLVGTNAA